MSLMGYGGMSSEENALLQGLHVIFRKAATGKPLSFIHDCLEVLTALSNKSNYRILPFNWDKNDSPSYLAAIEEIIMAIQPQERHDAARHVFLKLDDRNPLKKWAIETALQSIPDILPPERQKAIDKYLEYSQQPDHTLAAAEYRLQFLSDYPWEERAAKAYGLPDRTNLFYIAGDHSAQAEDIKERALLSALDYILPENPMEDPKDILGSLKLTHSIQERGKDFPAVIEKSFLLDEKLTGLLDAENQVFYLARIYSNLALFDIRRGQFRERILEKLESLSPTERSKAACLAGKKVKKCNKDFSSECERIAYESLSEIPDLPTLCAVAENFIKSFHKRDYVESATFKVIAAMTELLRDDPEKAYACFSALEKGSDLRNAVLWRVPRITPPGMSVEDFARNMTALNGAEERGPCPLPFT